MNYIRLSLLGTALFLTACAVPAPGGTDTGSGDVACTMDAKLCPDGSYVGRQGPNCEFTPCPGENSSSNTNDTTSDGTISFTRDASFALAVNADQVTTKSYIPPCDEGFTYCLFYTGGAFDDTNFDSAGVSITKRDDLSTSTCLTAQPDGYSGQTPATRRESAYATSVFTGIGDAGAGHYATDTVYRLSVDESCYEMRTRIGESQFANYPAGTIEEFNAADKHVLNSMLHLQLERIKLADGTAVVFPDAPAAIR